MKHQRIRDIDVWHLTKSIRVSFFPVRLWEWALPDVVSNIDTKSAPHGWTITFPSFAISISRR